MENEQTLSLRRAWLAQDLAKLEGRTDAAAEFARAHLIEWRARVATVPFDYLNTMDPRVDPGSTGAIAKLAYKMASYEYGRGNACADLARAKHVLSVATMVAAIAAESDFSNDEFPGASEAFDLRWRYWAKANSTDAGPPMPVAKLTRKTIVRPQDYSDPETQEAIQAQQRKNYPNVNLPNTTVPRRSTVG